MERAWELFGDPRYERLAAISIAYLYNLRQRQGYQRHRQLWTKTKPVSIPIGLRRAPVHYCGAAGGASLRALQVMRSKCRLAVARRPHFHIARTRRRAIVRRPTYRFLPSRIFRGDAPALELPPAATTGLGAGRAFFGRRVPV